MADTKQQEASEHTIAVFELNGEAYGVDTGVVREIARMQDIAPVPNTPAFIDGVMNLRGRIIAVVDLRTRFGMPRTEHDNDTRIVIVELAGNLVGMIVDAVNEIRTIQADEIDDTAVATAEVDDSYVRGMLKLPDRLIIMLDLEQAFNDRLAFAA